MTSTRNRVYAELLRELVQARKEAGLTQTELAEQLGKPQSFVSKYERGERRLDIAEYIEISKLVGLDLNGLFDGGCT